MTLLIQTNNLTWIKAYGRLPSKKIKNRGKWMTYIPIEYANDVWKKIQISTEQGNLGYYSKMSAPILRSDRKTMVCVLCVYTYDCHDIKDIIRVREELRKLGFVKPISYQSKSILNI